MEYQSKRIRLYRRDFVDPDTARCSSGCNMRLSSGTAWMIGESDDSALPYGPVCAHKIITDAGYNFKTESLHAPNYTSRSVETEPEARAASPTAQRELGRELPSDRDDLANAVRYIVLRKKKLAVLEGIKSEVHSFQPLNAPFAEFVATGTLSAPSVKIVKAIEAAASKKNPKYSHVNLLDVYTAHELLRNMIARHARLGRDSGWLKSCQHMLIRDLTLRPGWAARLRTQLGLHKRAFAGG